MTFSDQANCAACGDPVSVTDEGGCVGVPPNAYHFRAACLLEAARREHAEVERLRKVGGLPDVLAGLSADNDVMRVGAVAFVGELLGRPAQAADVGRGHECAFGAALRILSAEIERGNVRISAASGGHGR